MKAIGYTHSRPIDADDALLDIQLPEPTPGPRDLLVEVRAISVNPVDTKVRQRTEPAAGEYKVLGWDAAGVVRAVGSEVSLFRPGDEVFYAGDLTRPGSNAELQLVDERIVGAKPARLDFAQAAALPLTSITAWELLFERLQIAEGPGSAGQSLLIVGAAGGVGSILVQLARHLTGVTVIGTASRAETREWVRDLGAHHVIDHGKPLSEELQRIGIGQVSHVASLTHTDSHLQQIVASLRPQGRLGLIDDPANLNVSLLKQKSLSLHWEFMYTRSMFQTDDMIEQHRLLQRVSSLVDQGVLRTTLGEHFGRIDAANLRRAHALLESGKAKGKIVLEGF
ncbi:MULTISPECIES: zinc-binding alcohol dehydrogenase family protein [Pseudomonas]|uniref:zinc-binding alcohol dehydrogenase family protein n=1 Tax=Pseudomonas TaxID=286 RepID=UPI0004DA28F0|nr:MULTISPECIES: zinc-binding alcohol dehydrogenase family protein [Pseudomonas]KES20360.1 NADPH:quinone reductase [Pseudomonas sp. AAC]OHS09028.1 NADPH:quinone reductase [Pseudomonas sp. HMSC75E02]WBG63874.1 zinc-binding alcohol dehydrogenase family protein [Pseudomonas citronellolis]